MLCSVPTSVAIFMFMQHEHDFFPYILSQIWSILSSTVFRRPAHSISTYLLGNPPIELTELTIAWEGAWFKPATVALLYSQVHYHWAPLACLESAEIRTGTSSCNMIMVQHTPDRDLNIFERIVFFHRYLAFFLTQKTYPNMYSYIINIKSCDDEHWPLPRFSPGRACHDGPRSRSIPCQRGHSRRINFLSTSKRHIWDDSSVINIAAC